jgi:hypothetical protein
MRRKSLLHAAAICAIIVVAACVPPRAVGFDVVYVDHAPPPRRVEVIPVRPDPAFVWIEGHWVWAHEDYVWRPGRWQQPPRRKAKWVQGHWHRHGRQWYWQPGHWKGGRDA